MEEILQNINGDIKEIIKQKKQLDFMAKEVNALFKLKDEKENEAVLITEKEAGDYKNLEIEIEEIEQKIKNVATSYNEKKQLVEKVIDKTRERSIQIIKEKQEILDGDGKDELAELSELEEEISNKLKFDNLEELEKSPKLKLNEYPKEKSMKEIEKENLEELKEEYQKRLDKEQSKLKENKFIDDDNQVEIKKDVKSNKVNEKRGPKLIGIARDGKISIKFDAEKGCFITQDEKDMGSNFAQEIKMKDILPEEKQKLKKFIKEKYQLDDKNMKKIDMNVASILVVYDRNKNDTKLHEYVKTMMIDKNEIFYKEELGNKGISIEYDMRGLYSNKELDIETKRELMNTANRNDMLSIGKVKKGLFTTIQEKLDKYIFRRREKEKILKLKKGENSSPKSKKEETKDFKEQIDKENFKSKEEIIEKETTDKIIEGAKAIISRDDKGIATR